MLAWTLGGGGVLACVVGGAVCIAIGAPNSFLLVYLIGILLGVLGALVAIREPRNKVGWLMIAYAWIMGAIQLPGAYGYVAVAVHHGAWPLGSVAAWLGGWAWTLSLGFLAVISVRFPDGDARRFGRIVDWIYVVGTALFAFPIAASSPKVVLDFAPLPGELVAKVLPYFQDPGYLHLPAQLLAGLQGIGLTLTLLGNLVAAGSVIGRYRGAQGDERQQIKWFAYAGALCAVAVVYGGVAWNFFGQPLYLALTPLEVVALSIPASIGVAILRYRLYDIDLIINRTLVYGSLTAILGAVYAAVVTLLNRLFIAASGQKSDAAYVVTAFVVVVASSPVKDWLQRQVDRRIAHRSPSAVLDELRSDVDAVVSVIDVHRVARRLVDDAVTAFNARGAALYLNSSASPAFSSGRLNGESSVEVVLRYEDQHLGRLVLGSRRGDLGYTAHDVAALQRSADAIAEALALAQHLGFKPLPRSR